MPKSYSGIHICSVGTPRASLLQALFSITATQFRPSHHVPGRASMLCYSFWLVFLASVSPLHVLLPWPPDLTSLNMYLMPSSSLKSPKWCSPRYRITYAKYLNTLWSCPSFLFQPFLYLLPSFLSTLPISILLTYC